MNGTRRITLKADVERYGSIAERWPPTIIIEGTDEQIEHFLTHGCYEAGCDELFMGVEATAKRKEPKC